MSLHTGRWFLFGNYILNFVLCFVFAVMETGSKRGREEEEEEEENRPESSHTPPTTKKLRLKPTIALQVNVKINTE